MSQAPAKSAAAKPAAEHAAMSNARPEQQHQWLQQLVGEWTYESDTPAVAGQPATKSRGTERVRSIGKLWVVAEGDGEMPDGSPATTVMTLGYDPVVKAFVGTWVGSMMTHLWTYKGALDAAERVLTLDSEGPSMSGDGTTAHYQDIIELKSADHRVFSARVRDKDGQWQQFMRADYYRRK